MLVKNVHVMDRAERGIASLPRLEISKNFDDLWSSSVKLSASYRFRKIG
jgi:hypothetical protein